MFNVFLIMKKDEFYGIIVEIKCSSRCKPARRRRVSSALIADLRQERLPACPYPASPGGRSMRAP